MTYEINRQTIREGINELMKFRVNEVLDNAGPFTLASALDNYKTTRQLAIKFGVDTTLFDGDIKLFQENLEGVLK